MPAPKFTAAELEEFIRLGKELAKRTGVLSEEGAKSLQRLSPEARIALDELLEGGARLGEVGGSGVKPYGTEGRGGLVWSQPYTPTALTEVAAEPGNVRSLASRRRGIDQFEAYGLTDSDGNPVKFVEGATVPVQPSADFSELATVTEHWMNPPRPGDSLAARREAAGNPLARAQAAGARTREAYEVNANQTDADIETGADTAWPEAWKKWENIPGMALGAGLTGAALLARPAQAQELQGDDFTPDDFAPEAPDDFVADDFAADVDQPQLEAATNMPAAEPVRPAGEFAPYLPGVSVPPRQPLQMSVGTSTPAPKFGVTDALAETGKQTWGAVKAAFAPFQTMKDELIAPVHKFSQDLLRAAYFGGDDPTWAERQTKPGGVGGWLREKSPDDALVAETLLRHAIGPTDVNTPGSQSPVTLQAINKIEKEFGPTGSAFFQSLTFGLPNLPFFLIPGAGQGAVAQGLTGGIASAMVDPEQSVAEGAVGGAVVGGALEKVVAPVASKGWQAFKKAVAEGGSREARAAGFFPVAVIPPEASDELADTVIRMAKEESPVIPSKQAPELPSSERPTNPGRKLRNEPKPKSQVLLSVVDKHADVHLLKFEDGQFKAESLAPGAKPPRRVPRVPTADAKQVVEALPNSADAVRIAKQFGPDSPQVDAIIPPPAATFDPGRNLLDDMPEWDASIGGDLKEGGVIVLEGGGGDGAARLYAVNDPKLQREVLRRRGLADVVMEDGTKVRGFLDETTGILFAPEPEELIPGAIKKDMPLELDKVQRVKRFESDNDLKNILIEREQLKNSLESEAARAVADEQVRQFDIQLGGSGNGDRLPPPPPMDPPSGIPPNPHNVDDLEDIRIKWAEQSLLQKVGRKLLAPTARGPRDLADQAMSAFSVQTFERLRDDTVKALNKAMPQLAAAPVAKQRAVQADLVRFLEGHVKLDQVKKLHPEIAATEYQLVQSYKQAIRQNESRLRELGMLAPEEDAKKLLGIAKEDDLPDYAVRMYYRFLLKPGEWSAMFRRDTATYERVVKMIEQDVFSDFRKYGPMSAAEKRLAAEERLEWYLGDPERLKLMGGETSESYKHFISDAGGSLKERRALRDWEKLALGELDNAFVRIAESMTRQKQLILQGEMWASVASNPQWSSFADDIAGRAQKGHTHRVPSDPHRFGKLAGRYVSPDVWEALVQAPQAQRNASTAISKLVNALKYNQTVANPGSWVTNFLANAQGAALSNLVNPFASPYKIGNGMLTFARDLAAHKAAPGLRADVAASRFERAMELGVVGSEYSTAEFVRSAGAWKNLLEKEAGRGRGVNALQVMVNIAKKGKDAAADLYSGIDSLWKYSTYVSGLEKGGIDASGNLNVKKAIDFIGDRYRAGMSDEALKEAVELEVARRIHFSFPMMDRVGEAVAKGGKAAGVVNPYIKVKSELVRVYAQLPQRMAREKGMAANMMGYALIVGGLTYALRSAREAAGIRQQELDLAFKTAPRAMQRFKPGATALWWRDANGRPVTTDLTQMFEPLTWMQGDPDASFPSKFLTSMALMPIDGSPLEPEITDLLAQGGLVPQAYRQQTPMWQMSGSKLLAEAISRLGPGIVRNTYNTLERGGVGFAPKGVAGPDVPQADAPTTAANLLLGPNRLQAIGGPEQVTREIQRLDGEIFNLQRQLESIGPMREGQSTGTLTMPLDKQAAMKKARDLLLEKTKQMEQLRKLQENAR